MISLHDRLGITIQQHGNLVHLLPNLGISVARINVPWGDIQRIGPDDWQWTWLDEIINRCQSHHLIPYPMVGYAPSWLGARNTPPSIYDWTRFIRAFGQQYAGRVQYVGIWNEPNIKGMYAGSVHQYVDHVLKPAVETLRTIDANYRICAPELSSEGNWPVWLRTFLDEAGSLVDILTIHLYARDGQAVWKALTEPRSMFIPQWIPWPKPSVKQLIQSYGPRNRPLPCWITETGFSDEAGEDTQARAVDQLLERLAGADWPAGLCYFQLIDDDHSHQGLYRRDGSMKPAGTVLQRYAGQGIG